jgi:hypothetical protein
MTLNNSNYKRDLHTMWEIIGRFIIREVEYWKMANLNIHFSLQGFSHFPLEMAKKLSFCIAYFDKSIDDMIPTMTHNGDTKRRGGWRHCDRYTKKNRVVPNPDDGVPLDDLRSIWRCIKAAPDLNTLVKIMCWDEEKYRRDRNQPHKNWKWNLNGLGGRTIEFRQSK